MFVEMSHSFVARCDGVISFIRPGTALDWNIDLNPVPWIHHLAVETSCEFPDSIGDNMDFIDFGNENVDEENFIDEWVNL